MKTIMMYGIILFMGLMIVGCSQKEENIILEIMSITPLNGVGNVAKTTSIEVKFSESMDAESFESRFSLHMGEMMSMPTMIDGLPGQFTWEGDQTMITFHPDSMLMDSTMYSICLEEGMHSQDHEDEMMMSGMMSHGMEIESGIISYFTTE